VIATGSRLGWYEAASRSLPSFNLELCPQNANLWLRNHRQ
jgi:hypothetical protein